MDLKNTLSHLLAGHSLSEEESYHLFQSIMSGEATASQIAGCLIALRLKGETVPEITGAAKVMRALSTKVSVSSEYLVDTCGTGGDGASTFNISTAVAFVAAAAGARVAKHGNRSVSSRSGSADLLEAAGVQLNLGADAVGRAIDSVGVGFLFAPSHHRAMKHAVETRRELGVRTIFNLLGPLTNPASAPNQLLGVYDAKWIQPIAEVLRSLGSRHVMVVAAEDGLDEMSLASVTHVAELKEGRIHCYDVQPEDYGFARNTMESLKVNSPIESLDLVKSVLANEAGPALDIVLFNAGAAIYVSGMAQSLAAGVEMARDAVASGLAGEKLKELVSFSECAAS